MKSILGISLALILVSVTGCKNYSSPEGVTKTAYAALMKMDNALFISTLTKNGRAQFSTDASIDELRKGLELDKRKIAKTELVTRRRGTDPNFEKREYKVTAVVTDGQLKGATLQVRVLCDVYWVGVDQFERTDGVFCRNGDYRYPRDCTPNTDTSSTERYERVMTMAQDCRVDAIL